MRTPVTAFSIGLLIVISTLLWVPPTAQASIHRWHPVTAHPVVLRPFDPPPAPWLPGHRGVDLAMPQAQVRTPSAGEISWAGWVVDRPVVVFTHSSGARTAIEPVETWYPVGTQLPAGVPFASLGGGRQHCVTPCVHWSVRINQRYVDPMRLHSGYVRLFQN